MQIRAFEEDDLDPLVELTIEVFRPFYEQSFPAMVDHDQALTEHQHGQWEQDYRDDVPTLHDPDNGRHVLVAEAEDGMRFVGLGTGGDDFHAPARRLYEATGFHPIPIVGYLRSL